MDVTCRTDTLYEGSCQKQQDRHTQHIAQTFHQLNPLSLALSQSSNGINDQAKTQIKRTLLPSLAAVLTWQFNHKTIN